MYNNSTHGPQLLGNLFSGCDEIYAVLITTKPSLGGGSAS
jgi:hypothetical protein